MHTSRVLKGKNLWGLILAMGLAFLGVAVHLRMWEMKIWLPELFEGDITLGNLLYKSIAENGLSGLWTCPRLGAPEESALVAMPFLDTSIGLEAFFISRFFKDPDTIAYLMFLITFPAIAGSMYLLLNRMTDRVWLKTALAVAFALAPYHFLRSVGHLTLGRYACLPIAIWLMTAVYEEEYRGPVPKRYLQQKWKMALYLLGALYIGLGNVYYAFFSVIAMGIGIIGKAVKTKKWSVLWKESCVIYIVLIGVGIGLIPRTIYSLQNSTGEDIIIRTMYETDLYSLRLVQLLLPVPWNRIEALAELNVMYNTKALLVNENSYSVLGTIATLGFGVACCWVIYRLVKPQLEKEKTVPATRMNLYSLCILALVLYCSLGGFANIFSFLVTAEIRAGNRSSILIAALSLCALCIAADWWAERIRDKKALRITSGVLAGMLAALTVYMELPMQPENWQSAQTMVDDNNWEYFAEVEASMEPGDMVYQLPFLGYPEVTAPKKMGDYAPALCYVYTDTLRWSFGGIRKRQTAAEDLYVDEGGSNRFVRGIMEAGFKAVMVDRYGYEDDGRSVMNYYEMTLGLEPLDSWDHRWAFYKLPEDISAIGEDEVRGFAYVRDFASATGANTDRWEMEAVAGAMIAQESLAEETLWRWIETSEDLNIADMDNVQYVQLLYTLVLGRGDPNPEGWAVQIGEGGYTRRGVFDAFLYSDEFQQKMAKFTD